MKARAHGATLRKTKLQRFRPWLYFIVLRATISEYGGQKVQLKNGAQHCAQSGRKKAI